MCFLLYLSVYLYFARSVFSVPYEFYLFLNFKTYIHMTVVYTHNIAYMTVFVPSIN